MDTAPAPRSRRARWWYVAALLVTVVVRCALLAEKPFWRDEAWVAMMVEGRSTPDFDQNMVRPAPAGFVVLSRITGALPVSHEVGYRLPALIAGIALVPVLGRFASALGAPAPIPLLVVWLAAGVPALVYYSRELKPYGMDALCASLAPLLALRMTGRAGDAGGLSPSIAAAGLFALVAIAPWLTFGGQFAVGATLAWGSLRWWRGADTLTRRRWLVICAVFAVSFAAAYAHSLAAQSTSPTLKAFWRPWTLGEKPDPVAWKALVAVWRYGSLTVSYVFASAWPVLLPIAALGAATWPRSSRPFLSWLYFAPGVLAVAAALADRYLLAEGRLLLFAAPPLLLAAASGFATGGRVWRAHPQALALTAAVAACLAWSTAAIVHRLPPYENDLRAYFRYDTLHDVDAVLTAADTKVPPGAPAFVSLYAQRQYTYYGRGRLGDATICAEPCPQIGDVFDDWVRGLSAPGWLLLIGEESESYARRLPPLGAERRVVATARGTELWEIDKPRRPQ